MKMRLMYDVCVRAGMSTPQYTRRGQKTTFGSQFSLSTVDSRELGASHFCTKHFYLGSSLSCPALAYLVIYRPNSFH